MTEEKVHDLEARNYPVWRREREKKIGRSLGEKMKRISGIWEAISCVIEDPEEVATETGRRKSNGPKFTKVAERSKFADSGISVNPKEHTYEETHHSEIVDNQT